jgi:hypothetical protein
LFIEQDAGDFSIDIIEKDQPEGVAIIENHLGKPSLPSRQVNDISSI